MSALLRVERVAFSYGSFKVLHDVSFAVPEEGVVAVLGPNGAGKSTLLRVVSGLERPTAGRVLFAGRDVTGLGASEVARAGVCLVPEGRGIFPSLTVEENLRIAAGVGEETEEAFELFGVLEDRLDQVARTLSGGEQQMLALARAVLTHPRLLLLDELSLGLAPQVVDALYDAVGRIHRRGGTVVLVEQYVERALELCELVVVCEGGRVRFAGEPGELAHTSGLDAYLGSGTEEPVRRR